MAVPPNIMVSLSPWWLQQLLLKNTRVLRRSFIPQIGQSWVPPPTLKADQEFPDFLGVGGGRIFSIVVYNKLYYFRWSSEWDQWSSMCEWCILVDEHGKGLLRIYLLSPELCAVTILKVLWLVSGKMLDVIKDTYVSELIPCIVIMYYHKLRDSK